MIMQAGMNQPAQIRSRLKAAFGIPEVTCPLAPITRGEVKHDGIIIEKWIWTSEPGSKVTSLLYRPEQMNEPIPAIVITNGHGGSKTSSYTKYVGPLYAKLGVACLVYDTIGEEERHIHGHMGTRAHDDHEADRRAMQAGRTMMGKMVLDTIRAVDFLVTRPYIDAGKLGVAGNSLGGAIAGWMSGIDPRLKMSIVSGFGFGKILNENQKKLCTITASKKLLEICAYNEFFTSCASACAILVMNGREDGIITGGNKEMWNQTCSIVEQCRQLEADQGSPGTMELWFQEDGGHRGYHLHKDALLWIHRHLGTPGWEESRIRSLPAMTLGEWYSRYGLEYPQAYRHLYWNPLHHQGTELPVLDIRPIPSEQLMCLHEEERGSAEFTLEGWLDIIESEQSDRGE